MTGNSPSTRPASQEFAAEMDRRLRELASAENHLRVLAHHLCELLGERNNAHAEMNRLHGLLTESTCELGTLTHERDEARQELDRVRAQCRMDAVLLDDCRVRGLELEALVAALRKGEDPQPLV